MTADADTSTAATHDRWPELTDAELCCWVRSAAVLNAERQLTSDQLDVLMLAVMPPRRTDDEIAEFLGVSVHVVESAWHRGEELGLLPAADGRIPATEVDFMPVFDSPHLRKVKARDLRRWVVSLFGAMTDGTITARQANIVTELVTWPTDDIAATAARCAVEPADVETARAVGSALGLLTRLPGARP